MDRDRLGSRNKLPVALSYASTVFSGLGRWHCLAGPLAAGWILSRQSTTCLRASGHRAAEKNLTRNWSLIGLRLEIGF